jgi:exosortase
MITEISADIIDFIGITVYQEGNLLFFSNTQLEVAEACSGIRSLYSYIMLSCIFAMLCRRLDKKIIMIFAAIPLAIVVNIIRVSGTGVLSHYYGEKVAQGFFHEFTGFIVFALGFILLYLIFILLNYQGRFDAK